MISTCDFFYPAVDDPFMQGRIGACNVLSDMYSMGIHQIDNVLMILAASRNMEGETRDIVTRAMIEGFNFTCQQANVECTGGQSVVNPWPIIGGTAMSACSADEFIEPVSAVEGDVLILTKPLGTQVAVNLNEWRQRENHPNWSKALAVISENEVEVAYQAAVELMSRLNRTAAILMHKYKAHAATDVTGFGLLGHGNNLAGNQKANVDFVIDVLPIINKMEDVEKEIGWFRLLRGYSAETSGGLLVALPKENAEAFIKELVEIDQKPAWIIGRVVKASGTKNEARFSENFTVVHV
jgi:selenide,water dikinase